MNAQLTTLQSDQFATPEVRYSRYGIPQKFAVTLEAGNYLVYDEQGTLSRKRYQSFMLPLTALVAFGRPSRRTRIGNVTEQYLPSRFLIDINGICHHDPNRTNDQDAHEQKRRIKLWDDIADTILVSGKGFTDLDISEIEITDIRFGQIEGKPDQIPFAIRAESHVPYEVLTGIGNG